MDDLSWNSNSSSGSTGEGNMVWWVVACGQCRRKECVGRGHGGLGKERKEARGRVFVSVNKAMQGRGEREGGGGRRRYRRGVGHWLEQILRRERVAVGAPPVCCLSYVITTICIGFLTDKGPDICVSTHQNFIILFHHIRVFIRNYFYKWRLEDKRFYFLEEEC